MASIEAKIVLTGGPCAGKTTALSKLEQHLLELGYFVFIVPETATELINGGIKPFSNQGMTLDKFQNLVLQKQYHKEKLYDEAIKLIDKDKKCVILYDRGILDNKAYINQTKFDKLLEINNLDELSLMDNYNMVIHLVTAANGKREYYTLENNQARTENYEEAIALDDKTYAAWVGHSNLKRIDNKVDFEEKISKVINEVNNLLKLPKTTKKQYKYLIDNSYIDMSYLNESNSTIMHIYQLYFKNNDNLEYRLRKREYHNSSTYYYTIQKKLGNGDIEVILDKKITEEEFYHYQYKNDNILFINKTRYSFIYNNNYYRLDFFNDGTILLEIETNEINVIIPEWLNVISEVTNNPNYYNINMAKNKYKRKILTKNI